MTDETVTVAEISSFQLETIHEFHPQISAILNITPDHLNRHHTMDCYIKTKEAITTNQTKDEVCVLNYEDEVLRHSERAHRCMWSGSAVQENLLKDFISTERKSFMRMTETPRR